MAGILDASLLLWAAALAVGAADGLYFHLWRFRLYARPASTVEHLTHTVRACLLGPMLWAAFVAPHLGLLLALAALDGGVAFTDVWLERDSRSDLGGIPRAEYLVHVASTSLHSAALALALAYGWKLGAASADALVRDGGLALIACAVPVAVLHLVLALWRPGAPAVGSASPP